MNRLTPGTSVNLVTSNVAHGATFATGAVKASFATPLLVGTRQASSLTCFITADQIVTVYLRRWGASRVVQIDDAGTTLVAGTPEGIVLDGTTAGHGAGIGLGDEAELVVTNNSGSIATITAQLLAR